MALSILLVERVPFLRSDAPVAAADAGQDDRLVVVFGAPPEERPTRRDETAAATPRTAVPVEGVDYHVVAAGETLSAIAELRFGDASLAKELARLNDLDDPDALVPGQMLRLR